MKIPLKTPKNHLNQVFNPSAYYTKDSIILHDDNDAPNPANEIPDYANQYFANIVMKLHGLINTDNSNYVKDFRT